MVNSNEKIAKNAIKASQKQAAKRKAVLEGMPAGGTARYSADRLAELRKGFPTKDPKTGKVTTRKDLPNFAKKKKAKAKTKRQHESAEDAENVRERQDAEMKVGIKRGPKAN